MARVLKKIINKCKECSYCRKINKMSKVCTHKKVGSMDITESLIPEWCPLEIIDILEEYDTVDIVICGENVASGYIWGNIDNFYYNVCINNVVKVIHSKYLKKTGNCAEEVLSASDDDDEAYKEQDMDIKISDNKSMINVDELFNYLLGVEGLAEFAYGAEKLNEIEVKEVIKRFIDHYRFCIRKLQSFKFNISRTHYRNKNEESIKIFKILKGYILEDKIDFCYKAVDALTINQARRILDRFIYEYSGVKRSFKELM